MLFMVLEGDIMVSKLKDYRVDGLVQKRGYFVLIEAWISNYMLSKMWDEIT